MQIHHYRLKGFHRALKLQSPLQSLLNKQPQCHMLWAYTHYSPVVDLL